MAKLTLLQATQDILSALDFDPVSDIDETVESQQIAQELKTTYFTMMGERDWPHLCEKDQLLGMADTDHPTKMQLPEGVNKVKWIRYNNKKITYMDPESFQELIDRRLDSDSDDINDEGFATNQEPEYWTTFDDKYIWFDAFDSANENTMHAARSTIYVVKVPTWNHISTFTPDMPQKMFYGWLAEAKSACFINFKQTANAKEEKRATRNRAIMQTESWRTQDGEAKYNSKVNYGR